MYRISGSCSRTTCSFRSFGIFQSFPQPLCSSSGFFGQIAPFIGRFFTNGIHLPQQLLVKFAQRSAQFAIQSGHPIHGLFFGNFGDFAGDAGLDQILNLLAAT